MPYHESKSMWFFSILFILMLLVLDLWVFRKKSAKATLKQSAIWSAIWIGTSLLFNIFVYFKLGSNSAIEFFTGYLIEYSLSVDNLFIFMILFGYFKVPEEYQHRVLFFGIVGAILMRGVFIALGAAIIRNFHFALYIFGLILIASGVKLLFQKDEHLEPEKNPIYRMARRFIPMTPEYNGDRFWVKKEGRWYGTPMLLVLISVEITDLIFAVDSIPAIFAITTDTFIVFTSNIFAVLGLRSLYFLLAGTISKIEYLKVGLSVILCFVGLKMLIADIYKVPNLVSLGFIVTVLVASVVASLLIDNPGDGSEERREA